MSPDRTTIEVRMPKIGQVMESGTILEWHCESGQQIEQGALLVTIETDKAAIDIEAPASGHVHLHLQTGIEVDVGTLLAEIGDKSLRPAGARRAPKTGGPVVEPNPPQSAAKKPSRILASPRAKRLAGEHGLDLSAIVASATDGIISEKDVLNAVAMGKREGERQHKVPLQGNRKVAARQLTRSWQSIPHIVQMIDVDASALKSRHAQLRQTDLAVSLNDLFLHATAKALAAHPNLNGAVDGEEIVSFSDVNVGFAVESQAGLLVPVIRGADSLSIDELVSETRRLTESARSARLRREDMGGASLTVSNLGMYGIRMGTPVINPGESILVFVGMIEDRAVVRSGSIVAVPQVTLSIAFDHRLANGVEAAGFTGTLKQLLEESPSTIQEE